MDNEEIAETLLSRTLIRTFFAVSSNIGEAREMKAEALAKAGREVVSRVLKGEEFAELQQRAEEKIAV